MPPRRKSSRPKENRTGPTLPYPFEDIDLDELRRTQDWDGYIRVVVYLGDPGDWPEIERLYWEHPDVRSRVLFGIPRHWQEQSDLVVPLLKRALRDPHTCADALRAASPFLALLDDVVQCLQNPALLYQAGPDRFVATLACFFGLLEAPPSPMLQFAWGGVDPVLAGVTAELKSRYDLDLDELITGY